MKATRLFNLVLLALILAMFWSAPVLASDHPWDGTKVCDTLRTSNGIDGDNDGPDNQTHGGIFDWFIKWVTGSLDKNPAESQSSKGSNDQKNRVSGKDRPSSFRNYIFKK